MLMGDEDAIVKQCYSKTVICKSLKAECLEITTSDFMKLVKASKKLKEAISNKEVQQIDR